METFNEEFARKKKNMSLELEILKATRSIRKLHSVGGVVFLLLLCASILWFMLGNYAALGRTAIVAVPVLCVNLYLAHLTEKITKRIKDKN